MIGHFHFPLLCGLSHDKRSSGEGTQKGRSSGIGNAKTTEYKGGNQKAAAPLSEGTWVWKQVMLGNGLIRYDGAHFIPTTNGTLFVMEKIR